MNAKKKPEAAGRSLPLILHVGMYKTGTTTLQQNLFAKHPQILNVGKPYGSEEIYTCTRNICFRDRCDFDPTPCRSEIESCLSRATNSHTVALFSEEDFAHYSVTDRVTIAERLREVVGPATIIITIRNQLSLISSMYAYEMRGHLKKAASFEAWLKRHNRIRHGSFYYSLHYDRLIETYADVFGHNSVKVLAYELLARDPEAFAFELCSAIGVDAGTGAELLCESAAKNVGISSRTAAYNRLRSSLLPSVELSRFYPAFVKRQFDHFLRGGGKLQVAFPEDWRTRIEKQYATGNRAVAEAYRLPLVEYGYPI